MRSQELNELYSKWLIGLASSLMAPNGEYTKLFEYLYSVEFVYTIQNDSNRALDGINLRRRFARENPQIDPTEIEYFLIPEPCNVLEMLLALAFRMEDIMHDDDYGDRTGDWLLEMLGNINLDSMNNDNFDPVYCYDAISVVLSRSYSRYCDGGLFPYKRDHKDARKVELWYQMCWYLDELI